MTGLDATSAVMSLVAIALAVGSARFATLARRRAQVAEAEVARLARLLTDAAAARANPRPSLTCPICGRTSYHPEDVRQGYCGACHLYVSRPQLPEPRDSARGG